MSSLGNDDNNDDLRAPLLSEASLSLNDTTSETTRASRGGVVEQQQQRNNNSMGLSGGTGVDRHSHVSQQQQQQQQQRRLLMASMMSNFSTSYNVVNISLVLPMLLTQMAEPVQEEDVSLVASSLLGGMMVGQLMGGRLGDILGAHQALGVVMMIQCLASLASALLLSVHTHDGKNGHAFFFRSLALWRFLLGVGAGGVYPLAAVLSAGSSGSAVATEINVTEAANNRQELRDEEEEVSYEPTSSSHDDDKTKAMQRVVWTFSTQGVGFVTVPLVATLLLHLTENVTLIWKLMLGLGSLPALIMMGMQCYYYYYVSRDASLQVVPLEDPEERDEAREEDTTLVDEEELVPPPGSDTAVAAEEEESHPHNLRGTPTGGGLWHSFWHEPGLRGKVIGTAGTWFLFDVVFYGNTLFQPIVVEAAFGSSSTSGSSMDELRLTAGHSLLLTMIALPGYVVAGLLIGKKTCGIRQTPRWVMLQGFAAMSVLYTTIGVNWNYLRSAHPSVLVTLYGMTFFFANYGPNTTTFILPSLLFDPPSRSTWNGISAASGKLGALMGATLFAPAAEAWGDGFVMQLCAALALIAFCMTYLFVPKTASQRSHPHQQLLSME